MIRIEPKITNDMQPYELQAFPGFTDTLFCFLFFFKKITLVTWIGNHDAPAIFTTDKVSV